MPNVSLRKVRGAVGDTITAVNKQAEALGALGSDMGTLAEIVAAHTVTLDGHLVHLASLPRPESTFWQRLRWLVRGRG